MKNQKKKSTIGEMSNSRLMWAINPTNRIKPSKKGKGSYNRKDAKRVAF
ncbi:hypothetical protein ACFYKX_10365 [Cytobacillus sp. FJAT-54145]|uniref:Ribosome alternative rescue factor ArfA n=1 Tax=Cytobacillus spartinae TaxID=3299023 RepID=A0ABW6K9Z5_9BACI